MIAILITIAVLIVAIIGFRWLRYSMSKRAVQVAHDVLNALNNSRQPMNVSQLSEATGRNGAMVVNAIQFLHHRGWVAGTRNPGKVAAATDQTRYAITKSGRSQVRYDSPGEK
jgi:hypothetical protein